MGKVIRFRSRQERAADELLLVAEGLRSSVDQLEGVASLALRRAIERNIPHSDIDALRAAADLVIKASDVLAVTILAGLERHVEAAE